MSTTTAAIRTKCPSCAAEEIIEVPTAGLKAWRNGELIQCALPSLNATQREQLMTGYCQKCWDEIFADEDK